MDDIRVMEKPDWISWDAVQQCIHDAQLTNIKDGFDMYFGHMSGDDLRKAVGDGFCFVALNKDNRVIGTLSYCVTNIKFWFHRGKAGFYCYEGILPEYRSSDAFFELHRMADEKGRELGLDVTWGSTSEKNKKIIKINELQGWKRVQYSASGTGVDYYSVIMAHWAKGCPYKDSRINFMFNLSKRVVRFLFKPGKVFRFSLKKK